MRKSNTGTALFAFCTFGIATVLFAKVAVLASLVVAVKTIKK
jgi:hypothetical protein